MSFYRQSAPPPAAPPPVVTGPGLNTLAVVALVLAAFFPLGALVVGHIALSQIRRTGEEGRGMARWAVGLGYTALGFLVLLGLVILASATFGRRG
jgi:peptidyl-prolyl cis-trans isomerase B (cyclophilin B)